MKMANVPCAAAMVLTNDIDSAYAADGNGQSTLFTSVEAQQQQYSLAVRALQSPPCPPAVASGFACGLPWRSPVTLLPTGISRQETSGVQDESDAATTRSTVELSSQK
jgi:hypothetical protein